MAGSAFAIILLVFVSATTVTSQAKMIQCHSCTSNAEHKDMHCVHNPMNTPTINCSAECHFTLYSHSKDEMTVYRGCTDDLGGMEQTLAKVYGCVRNAGTTLCHMRCRSNLCNTDLLRDLPMPASAARADLASVLCALSMAALATIIKPAALL